MKSHNAEILAGMSQLKLQTMRECHNVTMDKAALIIKECDISARTRILHVTFLLGLENYLF